MMHKRMPDENEQKKILELWHMGLGCPKISQLVGVSPWYIAKFVKDSGLKRTKQEMVELRRKHQIKYKELLLPRVEYWG